MSPFLLLVWQNLAFADYYPNQERTSCINITENQTLLESVDILHDERGISEEVTNTKVRRFT
jgi:hypothetical protein